MTKISGTRAKTTHKATETKPKARTETQKPASKPKGWGPAVDSGGGESGRSSSYTPPPPSYSSGGGE